MREWESELDEALGIDPDDPQQQLAAYLVGQDMVLIRALSAERSRLGLGHDDMAERLGVSAETVADFERLGGDPRLSTIRRYALALGVRITHTVERVDHS